MKLAKLKKLRKNVVRAATRWVDTRADLTAGGLLIQAVTIYRGALAQKRRT